MFAQQPLPNTSFRGNLGITLPEDVLLRGQAARQEQPGGPIHQVRYYEVLLGRPQIEGRGCVDGTREEGHTAVAFPPCIQHGGD